MFKLCRHFSEFVIFVRNFNRYRVEKSQKTELAQSTTLAVDASLVTIPHLYQVNGKTNPHGESQVVYNKDWGYVVSSEPQTIRQSLNFYQYHSRIIQQAGREIMGEKLEYINTACGSGDFFSIA